MMDKFQPKQLEKAVQVKESFQQVATFFQDQRLFGVPVERVQEIVKPMDLTDVPMSANSVMGLINLRGQLATAISLDHLFNKSQKENKEKMNVICNIDGNLISFLVDDIGDVLEFNSTNFERVPENIPLHIKQFLTGVYKLPDRLLSVLDIDSVYHFLNTHSNTAA